MKKASLLMIAMAIVVWAGAVEAGAGVEVGAQAGYGFASGDNPMAFGFGVRGVLSFGPERPTRPYVGVFYAHFFGVTNSRPAPLGDPSSAVKTAHDQRDDAGFEFGVTISPWLDVTVRPSLQIGQVTERSRTTCGPGCSVDATDRTYDFLLFAPAIEVGFHRAALGVRAMGVAHQGESTERTGIARSGVQLYLAYDIRLF